MTPSLFLGAAGNQASELDVASGWGSTTKARAILEEHWETFIIQDDFDFLATIGINTVRLPIGYWNLGAAFCQDTPFAGVTDVYENSWASIMHAVNMAAHSGIGVLIDLHGAVGSQNGQTHSGISDGVIGLFDNEENIKKTIAILKFLIQEFWNVTNVVGIQILNEPQNGPKLCDFCLHRFFFWHLFTFDIMPNRLSGGIGNEAGVTGRREFPPVCSRRFRPQRLHLPIRTDGFHCSRSSFILCVYPFR